MDSKLNSNALLYKMCFIYKAVLLLASKLAGSVKVNKIFGLLLEFNMGNKKTIFFENQNGEKYRQKILYIFL